VRGSTARHLRGRPTSAANSRLSANRANVRTSTPIHAECERSLVHDSVFSGKLHARICNGVSLHFDGNFNPVLCVTWTPYGHQTFSTCTPRDRLLHYVGLSHLSFPVWPLGGAKGFFSTLNISAVFEIFAYFFTPSCRPSWLLQIPPYVSHLPLPVWRSAPKNQKIFIEKDSSKNEVNFPVLLHGGRGGPYLTSLIIS